MSKLPANLRYSAAHAWVREETDGSVSVGITDHAQEALGDLVFVELPAVGAHFAADAQIAIVESVKSASDVYAPLAGTVSEINNEVLDNPERINENAYDAWLFKLRPDDSARDGLLDAAAYLKSTGD
ncbi:glycine cleavage system protein GcvH [Azonexus sp.]|uniref:glycine cleavage system protein GcvH n=1 Tax=Azonexus sp. TaxID=1872668 RepID=UPI0039E65D27